MLCSSLYGELPRCYLGFNYLPSPPLAIDLQTSQVSTLAGRQPELVELREGLSAGCASRMSVLAQNHFGFYFV